MKTKEQRQKEKEEQELAEREAKLLAREKIYRVGDWIQFLDGSQELVNSIDSISHTINGKPTEDARYIPLTDDWLIKFGFERTEQQIFFDIWAIGKFKIKEYINGYAYGYGDAKNYFVSVNALQSNYRNATNKELTIQ